MNGAGEAASPKPYNAAMSNSSQWIAGINAVASALEHDAGNVREVLVEAGGRNARLVEIESQARRLGIDVRRSFTLVFAIGGAAAGIGGVLAMHWYTFVSPHLGAALLIFAFIVTVIGGLGSLTGAAIAAVLVAVLQQFANVYLAGTGDFIVVALLAVVLLVRPRGLMGRKA